MFLEEMHILTYMYNFAYVFRVKKVPDLGEHKLLSTLMVMSKEK